MPEKIDDKVRQLAIGRKIRTLREKLGLSQADLARRCSLPEVVLAQIEGDVIVPTVAALLNLAAALQTTMDSFFRDAPTTESIEVVRAGQGHRIQRMRTPGDTPVTYSYESLAYRLEGKHMEPFLVEFSLESDEPPEPVTHDGEEFLYITEGEVEFVSGGERIVLRTGDSIYFYSKTPHSLRGIGSVPPRALAVLYPFPGEATR